MKSPHRTAEQWQSFVIQHQTSGLSAPKFCEKHNIAYASFSKWRKRLAEPTAPANPPAFIELTTPSQSEQQPWAVEWEITGTMVLRIAKA